MKEALVKLLKVKSIMTLMLTVVFCYLSIVSYIESKDFMEIFKMIVIFYFGTQAAKDNNVPSKSDEDVPAVETIDL